VARKQIAIIGVGKISQDQHLPVIDSSKDFVLAATVSTRGIGHNGLPVFRNFQGKARYYGAEVEGTLDLARIGGVALKADAVGDYVHATIVGDGPAPRIPPLRLLGGLSAQSNRIDGRVEVEWTDRARRLAPLETPTDGFTLVNASLTFRPLADNPATSITLSANNIFDVTARRHASYLKDFAPLSGRDIRVTTRLSF